MKQVFLTYLLIINSVLAQGDYSFHTEQGPDGNSGPITIPKETISTYSDTPFFRSLEGQTKEVDLCELAGSSTSDQQAFYFKDVSYRNLNDVLVYMENGLIPDFTFYNEDVLRQRIGNLLGFAAYLGIQDLIYYLEDVEEINDNGGKYVLPEKKINIPCLNWAKGRCKMGHECKFMHYPGYYRAKEKPCPRPTCSHGYKCCYSHEL